MQDPMLDNTSQEHLFGTCGVRTGGSAPISVHVQAVKGGAEDVEQDERERPVLLLIRSQVVIGDHVPEHPDPKCPTHKQHPQRADQLNGGEGSMRAEHLAHLSVTGL